MSEGVFFEEEQLPVPNKQTTKTSLASWLVKNSGGLVTQEEHARLVLLVGAILVIIVSLVMSIDAVSTPKPPPPDQIINVAGPNSGR